MKFLIVGLGNIGAEYSHTRHNIGFDVVDLLAARHGGMFATDKLAAVCTVRIKGKPFVLVKPSTYMNLSGKAVNYWMQKEKIEKENLLVITDDLALPLGKLRLRAKGSDGGHNGLKNIQEILGTTDYPRLRFGIGNAFAKGQQVDFVLGKWESEETELLKTTMEKAADAVTSFGLAGMARTMNQYNT